MEKLDSDLLFRKAQALGDDIREMESIDVAKAFERTQQLIRKKRGRQMYDSLMRYAAFLTLPLLMISLTKSRLPKVRSSVMSFLTIRWRGSMREVPCVIP